MNVLAKNQNVVVCVVSSLHVYIIICYESKIWLFVLHGSSCYHSKKYVCFSCSGYEHVYMRPEVNLNWFEISNRFEKSFRLHVSFTAANLEISNPFQKSFGLHGVFTAATFQTEVRY